MKKSAVLLCCILVSAAPLLRAEVPTPPRGIYRTDIPAARRRAFFGELHLHTVMSLDAWTFGTKVTPDQAYKFARGETVMVPASQVAREEGIKATGRVPAKRAWPLDFTAVTDHAFYLGAMHQLDNPDSAFAKSKLGRRIQEKPGKFWAALRGKRINPENWLAAATRAADAWSVEKKAANDNYQPGKFTTFIAYEWTASRQGRTMHRNVIFNASDAPAPFTRLQSHRPEDLWKYLDSVRRQGIEVLAIPHNSNLSGGFDFDWNMSDGRPIDEAYAQERAINEPLVEIAQNKGASETTPQLSPADEFANFEIFDRIFPGEDGPVQRGSYVRDAWGRGLVIASRTRVNPFKMGVAGATDIHNGLTTQDEDAMAGGAFGIDPSTMLPGADRARRALGLVVDAVEQGMRRARPANDPVQFSSGAMTGVWAEENTRNAIFAALKRKETFATSGTRIRVRMFGGWRYPSDVIDSPGWLKTAYTEGVPMGGDLPARPEAGAVPGFLLEAQKDPDGANLDRIQVVKVWLDGRTYRQQVFDVALSDGRRAGRDGRVPLVGNTVDLKTGKYTNSIGARILHVVWRDPAFDPATSAVYYARVLEIPTPRWTTLLSIKNHLPVSANAPATIQERAWSSPIWYTPTNYSKEVQQ